MLSDRITPNVASGPFFPVGAWATGARVVA